MNWRFVVILVAFAVPCSAQKSSTAYGNVKAGIDFGPFQLVLGTPKNKVLGDLSEHYSISKDSRGDLWNVAEMAEPHFLVGYVLFGNGTLVRASRRWPDSNTAFSAIHITANLLSRLHDEGFTHCFVSTQREALTQSETDRDTVLIDCGQKSISITADRGKSKGVDFEGIDIVEVVEYIPSSGKR